MPVPSLRLFLLGSPRVEYDGAPMEVDTRKATALLAYLAVTGQGYTRDSLATLLWSDSDQSRARAALRRTLSTLNKALEGHWLDVDRDTLRLNCDASCWIDVQHFRELAAGCSKHRPAEPQICDDCLANL